MTEKREIEGKPGYLIGSDGSVWSCWKMGRASTPTGPWRKMKPHAQKYGHKMVSLRGDDCRYVHRLVLEAFIGPCPPGMVARHLNGKAGDNRLENLRWGTQDENCQDAVAHGTTSKGTKCVHGKLNEIQVREILRYLADGKISQVGIAKAFGVTSGAINAIAKGRSWSHVSGTKPPAETKENRRRGWKNWYAKEKAKRAPDSRALKR